MNKYNLILTFVLTASLMQFSFAKDQTQEISKSCLKDYPVAAGDTDAELINFYNQLCDKGNRKNDVLKQELSLKIAQRYQGLGYNLKALEVINQLRSQNVSSRELTDVTFLAGVSIAQNALNQMRSTELRSLTETSYAPAKQLAETIRFAQPTVEKPLESEDESFKSKSNKSSKSSLKSTTQSKRNKSTVSADKPSKPKTVAKTTATVKKEQPAVKSAPAHSGSSPFASLNK
ncbi:MULTISPECIES: hypothetical protein [Acinetobacter]|nr:MULTISPECIES: hypothetical protein [Acinetobacter]